jgi:GAF domain-containing protein
MTDRKAKKEESLPPEPPHADLKTQRDSFVHTFFKKGAELTDELLKENERLRKIQVDLDKENAALKTQLRSDEAIRDLLRKIEHLERDKQFLLSSVHEHEAVSTRFTSRFAEIEEELANMANLYVASYQLHSTLQLATVLRHLKELLAQLVGARAHAFYLASRPGSNGGTPELIPIASDGVAADRLPRLTVGPETEAKRGADGVIERVFLTGVPFIREPAPESGGSREHDGASPAIPRAPDEDLPAACVPMRIDGVVVGAIVVYSLLEQKQHFVPVDYELFKMLGAHAATALMGALLLANAEGKLPGLEPLHNLGA